MKPGTEVYATGFDNGSQFHIYGILMAGSPFKTMSFVVDGYGAAHLVYNSNIRKTE
jgi:hypothetical protein